MKQFDFIFNGSAIGKTKTILSTLCLLFFAPVVNGQIVVKQDFEIFSPNYANSFYKGSILGWVSTHGSPDTYSNYVRITPFEGNRYVHLYIEKAGDCSKSPDRGEGIALNYSFEPGQTYKLKYAVRGQVNLAQWILRKDPLLNRSSSPKYCGSGEIVPSVQTEDLIIKSKKNIDSENWKVLEVTFTIPSNSIFSQLWFRASNLNVSEKEKRTHLYLDAISLRKTCEGVDCEDDLTNQNLSENQNSTGAYLKPLVFPNPSSNELTMQLQASGSLIVEIEVFDAKGSLVKSFAEQTLPGGFYSKSWEAGKELGNGIFFIHFKTNFGTFQKRVVLQDRM